MERSQTPIEFDNGEVYYRFRVGQAAFSFAANEKGGDLWLVALAHIGIPMDW